MVMGDGRHCSLENFATRGGSRISESFGITSRSNLVGNEVVYYNSGK
jgi:hypothetical protein